MNKELRKKRPAYMLWVNSMSDVDETVSATIQPAQ